ncbi:nucleotide-diphospho-sugar transferase-domain-containing protein [Halteromyces radiatus]|uniref:nucleotide-diphospho-sugar transferase-domain-containing protein n=1 Tax=Halteromyces radiatus TaxID=101107 RepID=UPI0022200954|nr:nucleotide-diphospho-sugar transferase-domain-containing protein [Halteromyces radiatus]KAI8081547.1 nucleotide-diphospho-sugar transferase-domain-containing protein [Halteromyces radiatus]
MMTFRYAVIFIVVLVSLMTLHLINHTSTISSYSPSLAFESTSNTTTTTTNQLSTGWNSTLTMSAIEKSPWLCDCFHYGSPIPQLLRDTPIPDPDPITDGQVIPLIEMTKLTIPDDDVMKIINNNLHWPRTLIITVANYGIRHYVYNWIRSLERTHEERYVIVCLDKALYDHLYKAGYGNHAFVIPSTWMHYSVSSNLASYPTQDYRLITFTKSVVVQHILHLDISALYSDVDVVWIRPRTRDYIRALMDVRGGGTHVLFQQDDMQQHRINSGFFLMRPTPIMRRLMADTIYIQEQRELALWDNTIKHEYQTTQQIAMNEALSRLKLELRTSRVVLLDLFLFPNGDTYFYKRLHDMLGTNPYIVHANYLTGDEKLAKLKENGLWYVDDTWLTSIDDSIFL